MDPNVAWRILTNPETPILIWMDTFEELSAWLKKGGFEPNTYSTDQMMKFIDIFYFLKGRPFS